MPGGRQQRRRRVSLRLDEEVFAALQDIAAANACTMQALLEASLHGLVERAERWGADIAGWHEQARNDAFEGYDAYVRVRDRAWRIDRERRARE